MVSMGIIGTFVPLYLLDALHASNQQIALLNSLPAVVSMVASIVGVFVIPRLSRFKPFTFAMILVTRVSYLVLGIIPWVGLRWASSLTLDTVALGSFPQSLGNLGWQALIAQLIPQSLRSSFFSQRNLVVTVIGLVATAITGGILQLFNPRCIWPYQTFFMAAAGFGAVEVFYLARHREPQIKSGPTLPWGPIRWATILHNSQFVRYTLIAAFFNFGWQLSWPLFNIFQIKEAGATGLWLGLFTVASQLGQIITFRWWGRLSDKKGGMSTLAFASAGVATVPWLTVLSTNLWYLTIISLESGIFLSGINLLLFTQLLKQIPKIHRPHYIAAYNVVLGAIAFMAPEFGIWCLGWLHMNGTMVLSSCWRLVGASLFMAAAMGPGSLADMRGLWWRAIGR